MRVYGRACCAFPRPSLPSLPPRQPFLLQPNHPPVTTTLSLTAASVAPSLPRRKRLLSPLAIVADYPAFRRPPIPTAAYHPSLYRLFIHKYRPLSPRSLPNHFLHPHHLHSHSHSLHTLNTLQYTNLLPYPSQRHYSSTFYLSNTGLFLRHFSPHSLILRLTSHTLFTFFSVPFHHLSCCHQHCILPIQHWQCLTICLYHVHRNIAHTLFRLVYAPTFRSFQQFLSIPAILL